MFWYAPQTVIAGGPCGEAARLHHRRRIHRRLDLLPAIGGQRHDSMAGFALYDVQALYVHAGVLERLGYLRQRTGLVREPQN